jgi:hypothetical protein
MGGVAAVADAGRDCGRRELTRSQMFVEAMPSGHSDADRRYGWVPSKLCYFGGSSGGTFRRPSSAATNFDEVVPARSIPVLQYPYAFPRNLKFLCSLCIAPQQLILKQSRIKSSVASRFA